MSGPTRRAMDRDPRVLEVLDERGDRNGWWIYLRPGWEFEGCHAIHRDTLAECATDLASVEPCDCTDNGCDKAAAAVAAIAKAEGRS